MILAQTNGLPIDINSFIKDPEVALLVIILVVAIYGAYKGWWVPGPFYKKEVDANTDLRKSLGDTTKAISELTNEIRQRGN